MRWENQCKKNPIESAWPDNAKEGTSVFSSVFVLAGGDILVANVPQRQQKSIVDKVCDGWAREGGLIIKLRLI